MLAIRNRTEESANLAGGALVANSPVVGAVVQQQLFVLAQEWRGIGLPLIPDQHDPTPGLQNPLELAPRSFAIKPMSSLRGGHHINQMIGKSRRFSCSSHAFKSGI